VAAVIERLQVDQDQIAAFVDALLRHASPDQRISLRSFKDGSQPFAFKSLVHTGDLAPIIAEAIAMAQQCADDAGDVVFCPPIAGFRPAAERKVWQAAEQDMHEAFALSVECDKHAQEARKTLELILGPATVVVASGGEWADEDGVLEPKLHLHWRLTEPATGADLSLTKEARALAAHIVGADTTNVPMVHPIRWPGSWHKKSTPKLTQIVALNEACEIELQEALELLREKVGAQLQLAPRPGLLEALNGSGDTKTADLVQAVVSGADFHNAINRLASSYVALGMGGGAVVQTLRGLMNAVPEGLKDRRWQERYADIPRSVTTAQEKFDRSRPLMRQVAGTEVLDPGADLGEDPGPDPQALFNPWERFVVPAFPIETLPRVLQDFVAYQEISTGADPAAIAMAALTACSAALDQQITLKMMASGGWYARPRLWTLLVGEPSTKKTPVMSACVRPLRDFEGIGVKAHKLDMARHLAIPKAERGDPPPPPTRFVFNNITSEALGGHLEHQDRGALYENDEVAGWVSQMEKYGKGGGAERSFWAQAFNGGPMTVDRVGRGTVFVQNLCVAFLGGIQPDRLSEVTNLTSDGLLQRLMPVMMRQANYPSEVPSEGPAEAYHHLVTFLLNLKPSGLRMDEGGLRAADEFRRHLFELERMDALGRGFCTFVGKLAGLHGSLALVLHILGDPREAMYDPVSERVVRDATRIMEDFVIPHALVFYQSAGDSGDWDVMRSIASYVLTSDKDRFTPSDFTSGVRLLRGLSLWDLSQKLSPIVAGGWLSEDMIGGAVKAWFVTPGLRRALAEQRRVEITKKAEILQKIRPATQEKPS
jgi:hypothetical protein